MEKSTTSAIASYLQSKASLNWFSGRNIWRMKQFYETYNGKEKLSPLVAESPWTNNLLIMTAFKTYEAKEFYLKACIENYYSKRELERQDGSSQQFFCFVISSIFLRSVSSSFCSSSAVGSSSFYFEAKICLPSLRTEYLTMASFFCEQRMIPIVGLSSGFLYSESNMRI